MLGYNRTMTHANINVLLNNRPGGEGRKEKRRLKSSSLHNTFDDDCRFLFKMTFNIAATIRGGSRGDAGGAHPPPPEMT